MRQWMLLGAVALAACSGKDDPVDPGLPGPAASVKVNAVKSVMVAGVTQQLTASVYDDDGKPVPTPTVSWSATPTAVGTVSSSGVLTAVAVGTVKVSATSGRASGSVDIQVDADPCTSPIALRVGEVRTFTGGSTVSCITLAATTTPSDFVIIGANTRPIQDDLLQYNISLAGVPAAATVNAQVAQEHLDPRLILERQELERVDAMHERLRDYERTRVGPVVQDVARRRSTERTSPSASLAVSMAIAAVGDTITVRVPNLNTGKDICRDHLAIRGVVRALSTRATIVEDTSVPAGGFTSADYQAIAQEFDNLIFPVDTAWFGRPTDINNDGRITILYTPEVNKLTPSGSTGFTAGFFFGSDLIKRVEYPATNECRNQTNEQELFYVLSPDPQGQFNNVRSTVTVRQSTRGVIAHEFQHMINQSVRQFNPAVEALETFWLNEALSHIAEEAVGRARSGHGDFQRLRYSDVNPNPAQADDYNAFHRQNLARFQRWMQRPDTSAPVSIQNRNQLAPRGASWALVRYVIDQYSGGAARAFTRALAAGPQIDVANLLARTGTAQFDQIIAGWLVANYAEGLNVNGLAPRYGYLSWNMRDVMSQVNSGAFPLQVTSFPGSHTTQALSSSGNYFRLARAAAGGQVQIRLQAPGGGTLGSDYPTVIVLRVN